MSAATSHPVPGAIGARPVPASPLGGDMAARREMERLCRENVEVLAGRGIDLRDHLDKLLARLDRLASVRPDAALLRIQCEQAATQLLGTGGVNAGGAMAGVVVEGIDPPWLFERLWRGTPRLADGYSTRLWLLQADEMEFLDGLSKVDLREVLADPRVEVMVGRDASERLKASLLDRHIGHALPSKAVRTPGLQTVLSPSVGDVLGICHEKQGQEHQRLLGEVGAIYGPRDRAWWSRRYREAMQADGGSPLRVLIPISRYSTFVRHSAADLAESIRKAGHEAQVLTEPDDHTKLASPAYLRAFAEWKPDLVVLINFTRRHMGQSVPANVPFVCWVQDRMQHLFDEQVGRSQGELDFLLGHLHPELSKHFGYPKNPHRRLFSFVPASAARFHDGPVTPELLEKHRCEVAYISHQSETPAAMHGRLLPAFAGHPGLPRVIESLRAALDTEAEKAEGGLLKVRADRRTLVADALKTIGVNEPDPRMVATIIGNYVVPMAERLHRHRTLLWAAQIAESRGWRFHLYGRGWEKHPELAAFAKGALSHDEEELRAVYRAAAANLHISLNTNSHQRVYECALSSGLMLRRGPSPDWDLAKVGLLKRMIAAGPVEKLRDGSGIFELDEQDEPRLASIYRVHRLELPQHASRRAVYRKQVSAAQQHQTMEEWPEASLEQMPDFAFEPAGESLFWTKSELETMVGRAVNDRAWRDETVESHRLAALKACTCDVVAEKLLGMVSGALGAGMERMP